MLICVRKKYFLQLKLSKERKEEMKTSIKNF